MNNNYLAHYGVLGMKWGRRKTAPSLSTMQRAQKSAENAEAKTKLAKQRLIEQKKINKQANREWSKAYDKLAAHPIDNLFNTKKGREYSKDLDSKSEALRREHAAYKKAKAGYKSAKKMQATKVKDVVKLYEKEIADGQGFLGNLYGAYTGSNKGTASLYYEIAKKDPDFRKN